MLTGQVAQVVVGDTIDVQLDGGEVWVVYIDINTPETKHPDKGVEPLGSEADAIAGWCRNFSGPRSVDIHRTWPHPSQHRQGSGAPYDHVPLPLSLLWPDPYRLAPRREAP